MSIEKNYLSREAIIGKVKEIVALLEEEVRREDVITVLYDLIHQAGHQYNPQAPPRLKEITKLETIVSKNPGIKYRALADKMGRSVNHVKRLVRDIESIEERALPTERGMYGHKPYGLWLT